MRCLNKTSCLMYHQITDDESYGKFRVGVQDFIDQISLINELNIESIDISSEHPFNIRRGTLITFDDGHVSNLQAARLLAERGLKGVFYVIKNKSLSDKEFLSRSDIVEISMMGHALGVHGVDHKWWTKKSPDQLITELKDCKEWIEDITGKPVLTCSAPGGRLSAEVIRPIIYNIPEFKYIRSSVESYNTSGINERLLNSVAVCADLPISEYRKLLTLDRWTYIKRLSVYRAKEVIKGVLGR